MSFSCSLENVYLQSVGTVVGQKEKDGPLGHFFDECCGNCYGGEKSFEDGEVQMVKRALAIALRKRSLAMEDIPLVFGGDLSNQIAVSSMVMKDYPSAFVGVYGACSTGILALAMAGTYVDNGQVHQALAFTSSNFAVAERQFRYPNDYGIQKKDTVTTTITGAAAFLVSQEKTPIRMSAFTYGSVFDPKQDNLNDVGSPMAYAAYQTIKDHLAAFEETFADYDLIVTGDLSQVGSDILKACFKADGYQLDNHQDTGLLIYEREMAEAYAGGSGPACVAVVTAGYLVQKLLEGKYHRLLIVGTGALYSPTFSYQKNSIPVIAHAIVLENTL